MPKTPTPNPAGLSGNSSQQSRQSNKQRRPTSESATQQVLARLNAIDAQMAELTRTEPDPVTQQIAETLNSQSQAIVEVAAALKGLQTSLASTVAEAIASQRTAEVVNNPAENHDIDSDSDSEHAVLPAEAWDDIRNAFLASHDKEVATADSAKKVEAEAQPVKLEPAEEPETELPPFNIIGDPDALNEEELRAAVIDQERTISALVRRLQKKNRAAQSMTQEQLEEFAAALPEELQQQVTETLQALNNQHRYAELELSLERARVSRQASQLEVTRERLDARARAMGIEITESGTIAANDKAQRGSKARNWLGAMGFGN